MPDEIKQLSESFMTNPVNISVKKEALTLDGIKQFYIGIKFNDWKYDILKDLYETINISQCIIYINSKAKLMDVYNNLMQDNFPVSFIHGDLMAKERKETMNDLAPEIDKQQINSTT